MGNFNFEIPDELHKEFKIKSIKIEKDMQDILVDLIQDFVEMKICRILSSKRIVEDEDEKEQ